MSNRPLRLLAFDLGASSGRAVLGTLERGRLAIAELHRFANGPIRRKGHLHWDTERLFREVVQTLRLCAARRIKLVRAALTLVFRADYERATAIIRKAHGELRDSAERSAPIAGTSPSRQP